MTRPPRRERPRAILGVDASTTHVGWCVLLPGVGTASSGRGGPPSPRVGSIGTISPKGLLPTRLLWIENRFSDLLRPLAETYRVDVALEAPFVARSGRTSLALGAVWGIVQVGAARSRARVVEYYPSSVKKALTGRGNAEKPDVARFVSALLRIDLGGETLDATDAAAVAVCHWIRKPSVLDRARGTAGKGEQERPAV